jgi:2-oxoglutarate dehydrogenase E2 component (dihydrolipoamide succinyltransferase)
MSKEMRVPTVGESISEVTVGQWFKKDGDLVQLDEMLCELESDKATFEFPSEAAGVLRIKAQEGDTVEIGGLICLIEESATASAPAATLAPAPVAAAASAAVAATTAASVKDMIVPTVGESITEVTLANWLKKDGDLVTLDEIIAEVDSDKATFELPAEATGILRQVAKEGDVLEIGGLICRIEVGGSVASPSGATPAPAAPVAAAPTATENYATGHASPAAAKILAEKGIPATTVAGTGKDGRVTKDDALGASVPAPAPATSAPSSVAAPSPAVTSSSAGARGIRREKMSSLRKTVSRRLVAVKNETAMLTTFNEVNMKPIMDLRSKFKDQFKEKHGVGLGFMSFFTKAVCVALKEWPAVNAQIDGNEMVFHDFCDISVAVSAPKGLVVPVIRNAENLSFDQIEKEIVRLAGKARDNKLSIEEMTGGTFTITNGGVFGSMMSTPIINAPQSAILGPK